ncbi:MAG: chloride channel protein [Hyphomicrobiaceae bacterium]|nr:chloride channel protein [Hyphomicrobiaceae bacterium]
MDGAPQQNERESERKAASGVGLTRLQSGLLRHAADFVASRVEPNVTAFLAERQPVVWVLALVIGILVGYAALAFRAAIGLVQWPWLGTMSERVAGAAAQLDWWVVLLVPAIGGVIVGLAIDRLLPGRRAHGVADVIEARALNNAAVDLKTGLISAGLSAVSIGVGASVGREGPVVHLGATLAAAVEDRFKLSAAARRSLLAAGVASAVSASFNAPIAGVLFAHEVILAHYALRAMVPTVIASVAGGLVTRYHLDAAPTFVIPDYQITSAYEFPAFALLGLACAVVAIAFQLSLMGAERLAARFSGPTWVRTGCGGLIVGAIAVVFPHVLGVGYETTDDALRGELPLWLALALILAKTAATAVSLAARFAGGIFSPTLYLGAMTGTAFGIVATSVFPEAGSSHGLYAILGMGAVAAAVLGAPLSTTLMVFELTGGYAMTIALLLTVSIAVGVTQACLGPSLFHWQLARRGIVLQDGPHQAILRRMTVAEVMQPVAAAEWDGQLGQGGMARLAASDSLATALRAFDQAGLDRLAVVAGDDATRIVGHLDRIAALDAFNKALVAATVEAHR